MDSVKSFLSKKPTRKKVTFAAPPPKPTPASSNKKAGDKIVKMLSKENPPSHKTKTQMTQQEINNRALQIMYGSGRKK